MLLRWHGERFNCAACPEGLRAHKGCFRDDADEPVFIDPYSGRRFGNCPAHHHAPDADRLVGLWLDLEAGNARVNGLDESPALVEALAVVGRTVWALREKRQREEAEKAQRAARGSGMTPGRPRIGR